MPEPTPITTPDERPIYRLTLDPEAQEVAAVPVYQLRPAQASDLAAAVLQDPCQHLVGSFVYSYDDVLNPRSRFFNWEQLRQKFPASALGYQQAQQAIRKARHPRDLFWICYTCRYRLLLVSFDHLTS